MSVTEDRLWNVVRANSSDFNAWTTLIEEAETVAEDNILKIRRVYGVFLAEFPLCYGYWKNYADHDARLGSIDKVVEVYERAVQGVTYSVDIWLHYCIFANKHIWRSRHCKKYDCNSDSSHVSLERFDGNALLKSFSDVQSHGFEATRSGVNLKEFYRKDNIGCWVAGWLEEAEELIMSMREKPNSVIWGALLGACRTHGDLRGGNLAFKHFTELETMSSYRYKLAGIMFANSGERKCN